MVFELKRRNGAPLYLQIKERLQGLIEDGTLKPADRLPATRDLARSLAVNRNTVVRAYEELEVGGLVRSGVGQGTFVAEYAAGPKQHRRTTPEARADFEGLWSRAAPDQLDPNHLFFQVAHLHQSGVITLSSSLPDKTSFPMREFRNCAYWALQNYGSDLLDIGHSQGFRPFLEYLPKYLLRHGLDVQPEHLIVTGGIQQGIDLAARALINAGDLVITEEFTYPWAISVFRALGAELAGVPVDQDGMKVDVLEQILARRKAKLIYTIPTFQNPTGTTLPPERRRRLLELSAWHRVPVLEDHYANDLRLDGAAALPLAAMDPEGWVIGVGSISKVLFHGLRVGWMISPLEPIRRRLISLKRNADLQTSHLTQGIILEFMLRGYLEKYLKRRLTLLRARRNAMRRAIEEFIPKPGHWYEIQGGVCYWLTLPPPVTADEVLMESRRRGVVFAPKNLFSVNPAPNDGMRLGFTDLSEEKARAGMQVIGQAVRKLMAENRRPSSLDSSGYARLHV